jgi:hypothetical protein
MAATHIGRLSAKELRIMKKKNKNTGLDRERNRKSKKGNAKFGVFEWVHQTHTKNFLKRKTAICDSLLHYYYCCHVKCVFPVRMLPVTILEEEDDLTTCYLFYTAT